MYPPIGEHAILPYQILCFFIEIPLVGSYSPISLHFPAPGPMVGLAREPV
jgi:hypothetical protein